MNKKHIDNWSLDDSAALYGVHHWGMGLFGLNEHGELTVQIPATTDTISTKDTPAVSLMEIVEGIELRGHDMPVLLRIQNFLDTRIALLHNTFRSAIEQGGYDGKYLGVFPVKVNQQCQVIEEITRFGAPFNHGLEAGSKAELLLALAHIKNDGLLILNGYKDSEFIDLGLWATKLGHRCFFVIESPAELALLIERSVKLNIRPNIGARIKVSAKVSGLWTETSGDRSSFGLNSSQILAMTNTLRQHKMLDCLQLLHCHLGSQIPCLEDISTGVREACRYYTSLLSEGAAMQYLDLGGGLAVDYSGVCSGAEHSRNYSLKEYCQAIVSQIRSIVDPLNIPHPHIITESGRATVAYASMLLFNILDVMKFDAVTLPQQLEADAPTVLQQQFTLYQDEQQPVEERYQQAQLYRDQVRQSFEAGQLTLAQRALGEEIFLATAQNIVDQLSTNNLDETPAQLKGLRDSLADIYYANFSVFQSLPDTWAIGQRFPIAPLHRHLEAPSRDAIISDLTCDCDGQLDRFIVEGRESKTLPLHPFKADENYYLGVFLIGAYQETLGDIHNLFGDTHVISVRINPDGGFDILKEISGDSIGDVLGYVQHQSQELIESIRNKAEGAVRKNIITLQERQLILNSFSTTLNGYTYYKQKQPRR